jgi:hypothetical protein
MFAKNFRLRCSAVIDQEDTTNRLIRLTALQEHHMLQPLNGQALVTVQDGKVKTSLKDVVISLDGPSTIVGHSVVVHFGQDDLKSQVGSLVSILPCQSLPISRNCLLVRFAVCQQVTNVTFKRAHAF